jgi:DNA relaxase NicK
MDERAGLLSVQAMVDKIEAGDVTTKAGCKREGASASKFRVIKSVDGNGKVTGFGFEIGKRASDTFARVYDKRLEQKLPEGRPWVRIEPQFRNERANAAIDLIVKTGSFACLAGVLYEFLDFKEHSETDGNKSRWATWGPWREFLGEVAKCRLTIEKRVKTLNDRLAWLELQYGPMMAASVVRRGGDIGEIIEILTRSQGRMKPRHWAMARSLAA